MTWMNLTRAARIGLTVAASSVLLALPAGFAWADEVQAEEAEDAVAADVVVVDDEAAEPAEEALDEPAQALAAGWTHETDGWCYYVDGESGLEKATGLNIISDGEDGAQNLYYFNESGYLEFGWKTVTVGDQPLKFFFDGTDSSTEHGGAAVRGFSEAGENGSGALFYFGLVDGEESGDRGEYGDWSLRVGWFQANGVDGMAEAPLWYYADGDPDSATIEYGMLVCDRVVSIAGDYFAFKSDWSMVSGQWYEPNSAGNGWVYAKKSGALLTDCIKKIGGKYYCFDDQGNMQTGLTEFSGKLYYFNKSGALSTGLKTIGGAKYLFAPKKTTKVSYGAAYTSLWYQSAKNKRWYYFDENSQMVVNAWKKVSGKWYHFDTAGRMQTGWLSLSGKRYYLASSGAMVTGWKTISGARYYFKSSGAMAKGLTKIGDYKYGFTSKGKLITSKWHKKAGNYYYFDAKGRLTTGWKKISDKWRHFASDGVMDTGWKKINKKWYYFSPKGVMTTGWATISGTSYHFTAKGVWDDTDTALTKYAQGQSSNTGYLVLVDLTHTYVGVFQGSYGNWAMIQKYPCSVGAANSPTPTGNYTLNFKGYSFGHGYTCYYYSSFNGDYMLHSVTYYENTFRVMEGTMHAYISQGCVRLNINNAKWIYDNVPIGSKVRVYK